MILKGYGRSLNYPVPALRPCGDINIYLYTKDKGLGLGGTHFSGNLLHLMLSVDVR